MEADQEPETPYVVLASTKCWIELAARYSSPGEAEQAVTERGIYRVILVGSGGRLPLDPFAWMGTGDDG